MKLKQKGEIQMDDNLGEVKAILKKYGQEHLLNHYLFL